MRGHLGVFAILVIFWGLLARGANQCQALFRTPISLSDSVAVESLILKSHEIESLLQNKGLQDGGGEIGAAVRAYDSAVAHYLDSAGISFEVRDSTASTTLARLAPFILHGNPRGDEIARLLYTAEIQARRARHPLEIRFDPFFDFRGEGEASFLAGAPWTITFGPQALELKLAGLGHPLRHELQHLFEQIKVENGEFSLAQLELSNAVQKPEPYENYLRLDEAESFLRDLRFLLPEDHRNGRFSSVAAKEIRSHMIKAKLDLLRRILRDSRATLVAMQSLLKSGALQPAGLSRRGQLAVFHFISLPHSPYPAVSLTLQTVPGEPGAVKQEALVVAQRSLTRLSEIEHELETLLKGGLP